MNLSVPSDHRIAWKLFLFHAEICTGVLHEHVVFYKRARIAQDLDALAGRQFSLIGKKGRLGPDI